MSRTRLIVVGAVIASTLGFATAAQASADPIPPEPSCYLGVNYPYPSLPYPISFQCEAYTLPDGTVLNAIYVP